MRIRIESSWYNGKETLKKYPQLNKYKPIVNEDKELTIEITPDEVFKLAEEIDRNIIIMPDCSLVFDELKLSLEIYDDWRE